MSEPIAPVPAELHDVVRFIAAQQDRVDRRITYVGTDAAGIAAELDGIAPPWSITVRVQRGPGDPAAITGAVVVEWDVELGRDRADHPIARSPALHDTRNAPSTPLGTGGPTHTLVAPAPGSGLHHRNRPPRSSLARP